MLFPYFSKGGIKVHFSLKKSFGNVTVVLISGNYVIESRFSFTTLPKSKKNR